MMLALAVVLLIIGLVFVIAEVFFVSMGMLSLIAGACILGADVLAFQHSPLMGWVFIAAEVVLIPVIVVFAFRLLPRLPFGRRMLLSGPVTEPEGGFPSLDHLVGRTGEAVTDLRPSGTARFEEERVSVVGVGPMIPKGARVEVISVSGPEVKVRSESPVNGDDDDA